MEMNTPVKPRPSKRLYTIREAAEFLGRSEEAVRTLCEKGKLPVVRIDRRIQLDVRDLELVIELHKQPAVSE